VHGTQGMVKPGVQRTGVDKMCHSELFDVPQPLKIGMGNQVKDQLRGYINESVDRIIYDFLFVQSLKIIYTVQKLLFLSILGKLKSFYII